MELQDIAAIAEIVGVTTIVITFLFLGAQVRESNRAARSNILQSITQTEMTYAIALARYSDTWEKVVATSRSMIPPNAVVRCNYSAC